MQQYNLFKDLLDKTNETIKFLNNDYLSMEINIKLLNNINFLLIILFSSQTNTNLRRFVETFSYDDRSSTTTTEHNKSHKSEVNRPQVKFQTSNSNNSHEVDDNYDDDEDLSSQYSTLSSILGLQVDK